MRILLMTPTVNDDERRPDVIGNSKSKLWNKVRDRFGFAPGITPSYGLLYLSAALKKAGHETFYLDGNITCIEQVLTCISSQNVEIVGVSTLSFNWQRAKINIKTIKDKFPAVKIIIGGINATCLLEKCLEESPETDILVYGEAEESIVELVNRLENKKELNGTLGTLYRNNGNIIKNPPYPVNKNLDNIPFPDLEVLGKNIDRYRPAPMFYKKLPHASIFGSRGCPFKCTFCLSDPVVRKRDPHKVVDEIEMYVKNFNVKSLTFYDETLSLNKKWLKTICSEIVRRKLKISWSANVRADCLDADTIQMMKDSGCWQALFGVESGVQKNLNKISKGMSISKIQDAIELVSKLGIETLGMFMFGIPGETFEEGLETIRFACNIQLDYAIFTNITPFPGTALYNEVKDEKGFRGLENLTPVKINYVPSSMTEDELKTLLKLAYRRFYYRPSFIYKQLIRMRNIEDIKKNIKGFIQLWN